MATKVTHRFNVGDLVWSFGYGWCCNDERIDYHIYNARVIALLKCEGGEPCYQVGAHLSTRESRTFATRSEAESALRIHLVDNQRQEVRRARQNARYWTERVAKDEARLAGLQDGTVELFAVVKDNL